MAKNTSFIRWAGGKAWFVPAVHDMIQNLQFNNYIEPFMGGASIFFSLDLPNKAFFIFQRDIVLPILLMDNIVCMAIQIRNTQAPIRYLLLHLWI